MHINAAFPSTKKCAGTPPSAGKANKSGYKHVPHREKPPHLVARRNARERRRVQAVNSAFVRLRKILPIQSRSAKFIMSLKKICPHHDILDNKKNLGTYQYENKVDYQL
jgi:hypothetical protein